MSRPSPLVHLSEKQPASESSSVMADGGNCVASVKLISGKIRLAELHWYEAHGIGKRKMKIEHFFD
jgi:hypothetical protein